MDAWVLRTGFESSLKGPSPTASAYVLNVKSPIMDTTMAQGGKTGPPVGEEVGFELIWTLRVTLPCCPRKLLSDTGVKW